MNLQQAQQEQKDMKMYAKIYLVTGNSEKTEQVFLENGGSPVFAAKMREQRKAALIAEEEHTRKLTGDKLAAEKMKNDEIASIWLPVSLMPEKSPEERQAKEQAFYQGANQLLSKGIMKQEELNKLFPGGLPDPVTFRMMALQFLEAKERMEAMKPTVSAAGSVLRDPLSGEVTQIGEKPTPTPTDEDKAISDYMAAHNLKDVPGNRHLARVRVKQELAAAGREAKTPEEDLDKILTPTEAGQLGVPYGTTRKQAAGKTAARPLTDYQRQTAGTGISTLNAALSIMDKMRPDLDNFKSAVSGIHFQAAVSAARESGHSGIFGSAWNATISRNLPEKDKKLLGNWMSAQEHVQRMRAVMQGAAGFRSVEAFETLLGQLGSPSSDPVTTKETFENTYKTLKDYREVLERSVREEATPGTQGPPRTITLPSGKKVTIE
jgi:hypothetical protein